MAGRCFTADQLGQTIVIATVKPVAATISEVEKPETRSSAPLKVSRGAGAVASAGVWDRIALMGRY